MADPDAPSPAPNPIAWSEDGQPRSTLYGDVYFSAQDGLAESRVVFLRGCGLPDAWAGRARFVVGELGFGTGLNILALLDLWRAARPPGGQLNIFSVEAHPLSQDDAGRALARWPELADLAQPLLAQWPGRAGGSHRVEFPHLGAILDVAVGEAVAGLQGWSGRADAWFLDGFSPALNPAMWRDEVLGLVAARSAPGARAATFTVAGHVRRGLAAAGFNVEKQPGFGRKRERLAASLPGETTDPAPGRRVAIIGAGIAGAGAARAVRTLGGEPVIFEALARGAGASGNPAALVTPRLDAGLAAPARLFAQAFHRAVALYAACPGAVIGRGVLQLAEARDADRFTRIAASDLFEPGALAMISPAETHARLREPTPAALDQASALSIDPHAVLAAWAPVVTPGLVAAIDRDDGRWTLRGAEGEILGHADAVIVAAGPRVAELIPGVDLQPIRGQASWAAMTAGDVPPATVWGGYVLPAPGGLLFGATHDRGQTDTALRQEDHHRNLETLAGALPALAARLKDQTLEGRAAIRAATGDQLPLAGAAPRGAVGLYVLGGFGSRGFSLAPLLAEHVAALAMGAPSPLPEPLSDLVEPARFARRAARRGRPTSGSAAGDGGRDRD